MKTLLTLAFFLAVPAFAQTPSAPDWSKDSVKFSEDKRPVDGSLVELIFIKNENGSFNVEKHTTPEGLTSHKKVEFITDGVYCASAIIETTDDVICSKDMRPVDGAFVILTGLRDANGYHHFSMRTELDNAFGPNVKTVIVSEALLYVD